MIDDLLSCLKIALKLRDRSLDVKVAAAVPKRRFDMPMANEEMIAIRNNLDKNQRQMTGLDKGYMP